MPSILVIKIVVCVENHVNCRTRHEMCLKMDTYMHVCNEQSQNCFLRGICREIKVLITCF